MTSALRFPVPSQKPGVEEAGDNEGVMWKHVFDLASDANGIPTASHQKNYVGFSHDSEYLMKLRNLGSGGLHLLIQKSTDATTVLQISDTGLTVTALAVGTLNVTGNATIGGTLGAGATTVTTLHATGAVDFDSTFNVDGATTLNGAVALGDAAGDVILVNGTPSFQTAVSFLNGLVVGDANTDIMTVIGVTTFRNALNSATQLFIDAGNNRVIVGSATALGSDTTPNLQVIGRLYVAPNTANDLALQLRRSSGATVGWSAGVDSSANLIFKDDADTSIVRFGDAAATYQLDVVTGDFHVADDAIIDGDVSASRGVFGGTTFSGGEELRVVGQSSLEGATTVTTGNVTVSSGNVVVSAGDVNITGDLNASDEIDAGSTVRGTKFIADGSNSVMQLVGSSQTQSTVGGAGGAAAPPATPVAWVKIDIGGVTRVFPAYPAV